MATIVKICWHRRYSYERYVYLADYLDVIIP